MTAPPSTETPRHTATEIADAVEIISMCLPISDVQGGMWFGRNHNFADATFVDYGACRAFAVAARMLSSHASLTARVAELERMLDAECEHKYKLIAELLDLEGHYVGELSTANVEFVASKGLSQVTSWVSRERGDRILAEAMKARAALDNADGGRG